MSAKLPERRQGINCRTVDSRAASEILSADLKSYRRTIKYKSAKQESLFVKLCEPLMLQTTRRPHANNQITISKIYCKITNIFMEDLINNRCWRATMLPF